MSNFTLVSGNAIGGGSGIYSGVPAVPPDDAATTTIADVSTESTVTTLSSGAINLAEGTPYFFETRYVNVTGQDEAQIFINGDTTTTNYNSGWASQDGGTEIYSNFNGVPVIDAETAEVSTYQGVCGLHNGLPYTFGRTVEMGATQFTRQQGGYNTVESDFTELQLTSTTADRIGAGSYVKIWKLNQTPLVDVLISGGAVTTLSSGVIALTEGKTYMFVAGITNGASTASYNMFVSGDTTTSNYERGTMDSSAFANANNTGKIVSVLADTTHVLYGFMGVVNSVPYYNFLYVSEDAGPRAGSQTVYNTSETTLTQFDLTSSVASNCEDGSYLKIWEMF
jgi:hypothetical protein